MKLSEMRAESTGRPAIMILLLMLAGSLASCRMEDTKVFMEAGLLVDSPGEELSFCSTEAVSYIDLIPRSTDDSNKYLTLDVSVIDPNSQAELKHKTIKFASTDCQIRSSYFKVAQYVVLAPVYNQDGDNIEYRLKIISSSRSHNGFDVYYKFLPLPQNLWVSHGAVPSGRDRVQE